MSHGKGPYLLYYAMLIVMVGSSLVAMRLPMGRALKMALAWLAIFGAGFLLFSFRSEFSSLGARLRAEAKGTAIQDGAELRVPMAEDGHFYVDAMVNGRPVRFMVDSGASITTIALRDARAAAIAPGSRTAVVSTANGPAQVVQSYADRLQVGSIERTDFPIDVSRQDDVNLLGMNFLSSLSSWRVEGNYLVLRP